MSENKEYYDYRVRFSKHGAIRYIGHLDVMRYFQKVLRRAEVDVAYTNGFSPHEITTFAQPLGVGIESDGEYMDVRMNSYISCGELRDKINNNSVPGIQAISVKRLPPKSGNAMASVAAAEYYIGFKEGKEPGLLAGNAFDAQRITELINAFLSRPEIILQKEGKNGLREVDIKERIYTFEWDTAEKCFHIIVDASSGYNIKPLSLMELFMSFNDDSLKENSLLIYRADTYTRDEVGELISMGLIGTEE
ncbi:MAG: TIGR03936 family radical SAM-associated protein [Lachnospiraceae bacterium]|nr:TIGR03936 family radical SAM-associated protein [Lachnospiraceae bacterium]